MHDTMIDLSLRKVVSLELQIFTAQIFLLLNVGLFGVIVVVTLLIPNGPEERVHVLGWVCVSFSISVFIAPLSIIVSTKYAHFTYGF